MSEPVTFKLDLREFNAAYRKKLEYTKRGVAEEVNKTLYYVARSAARLTPRGNAAEIKAELGVVGKREIGQKVRLLKRGGVRPGKMITQNILAGEESGAESVATRLVRWRIWRGLPLPRRVVKLISGGGQPTADEGKLIGPALLASRLAAVGDVASGWIPAIKTLFRVMMDKAGAAPGVRAAKVFGRDQGRAMPARAGFTPRGRIENAVENRLASTPEFLPKHGGPALQAAFNQEAVKIMEYVKKREIEDGRRLGIRIFG
jgi:hypothetical protein